MGRGNYLPPSSIGDDYQMVYVPWEDIYQDETDREYASERWNDFTANVMNVAESLSPSLVDDENKWIRGMGHSNNLHVLTSNLLGCFVAVHEEDTYTAVVIGYEPDEYLPTQDNLSRSWVEKMAPKIIDGLSKLYSLRVRTSAWTSGSYSPPS